MNLEGILMKFLDLFSGIGGFRLGLEKAGHQAVGYVEIDKYARKSYENMYNTKGEWTAHDITKITDEEWREFRGRVDIITGGFPCQAFSTAGKRRGFDDTRGTLFFEVARAAKEIQPSFLFLENVKGLFSHDKGQTFGTIIQALDELGYVVEWGLFNSKFWGVPQNRERVFILATRKDVFGKPKLFDLMKKQEENGITSKLLDILEDTVEEKFYLSEEQVSKLDIKHNRSDREIKQVANRKGYNNNTRTYDPTGISGTLDTAGGGGREVHIKVDGNTSNTGYRSHDVHDPNGISPTITARDYKGAKQIAIIDDTYGYDGTRLYDDIAPTLRSSRGGLKVVEENSIKQIGNIDQHGEQDGEFNQDGIVSPSSFYAKDNVVYNDEQFKNYEYTVDEVERLAKIKRPNDDIEISVKENGDIRPHRTDKRKSGLSELNINYENNVSHTVTSAHMPKIYGNSTKYRIRKLTPKECFRLQGFSDDLFEKAQEVNSNSQLYKQAGNSVTVNVIEAIAKTLTVKLEEN